MMFADPRTLPFMRKELEGEHLAGGDRVPFVPILDSAHHVMFDQPLALVAALSALLGEWRRSDAQQAQQLCHTPTSKTPVTAARKNVDFGTLQLPSNAELKRASKL